MNKPNRKPKRTAAKRRSTGALTVQSQLIGKLGPNAYGRLLDQLAKVVR